MRKDKVVSEVLGADVTITPSDLYHAEFKSAKFGGYDKTEVDAYLERLADVLEELIGQVRTLKEHNEDLESEMKEFRAMERSLREAMLSSQRVSDDIVEAARREAKSLIEEARLKKLQAQIEASKVPDALSRDINLLKQQRMRLRVEITSILETHRQLLETLIPLGAPLGETDSRQSLDIVKIDEEAKAAAAAAAAEAERDNGAAPADDDEDASESGTPFDANADHGDDHDDDDSEDRLEAGHDSDDGSFEHERDNIDIAARLREAE
jgi:cell division initiation protein